MSNIWDDAAKTLGKVAPMLATAVGGPLAGAATNAIIGALGLAPDATQEAAAAAVAGATPDQLIALRKADNDFRAQMRQLDITEEKQLLDDRANARAREIGVKDKTPEILALAMVVGYFGTLCLMMFHVMPQGSESLLQVMLGALSAGMGLVLSYYYGSSAVSKAAAKQ